MSAIKLSPDTLFQSLKKDCLHMGAGEEEATQDAGDMLPFFIEDFVKFHGRQPDDQTTLQEWLDSMEDQLFRKIHFANHAGPLGLRLAQEVALRACRRAAPLTGYSEFAQVVEAAAAVLKQEAAPQVLQEALARCEGHMDVTRAGIVAGVSKPYSAQWAVDNLAISILSVGPGCYGSVCYGAWSAAVNPIAELALQEQDFKEIMAQIESDF